MFKAHMVLAGLATLVAVTVAQSGSGSGFNSISTTKDPFTDPLQDDVYEDNDDSADNYADDDGTNSTDFDFDLAHAKKTSKESIDESQVAIIVVLVLLITFAAIVAVYYVKKTRTLLHQQLLNAPQMDLVYNSTNPYGETEMENIDLNTSVCQDNEPTPIFDDYSPMKDEDDENVLDGIGRIGTSNV